MGQYIDPTVDIVFKALLGCEHHKGLLINFLNAILQLRGDAVVRYVSISNPYNPKALLSAKLSVVDVKAVDDAGRHFHVEIQIGNHVALNERMVSYWAQIYAGQLKQGDPYKEHKPVFSIWLLSDNLPPLPVIPSYRACNAPVKQVKDLHVDFGIYSPKAGVYLSQHCIIHVVQLKRFRGCDKIESDRELWVYFFVNGKNIDLENPPEFMQRGIFKEVRRVMRVFSEKEESYHAYLSRLDKRRRDLTIRLAYEETKADLERAEKEKEQLSVEKEQLSVEKEHLLALLKQAGINPDSKIINKGDGHAPDR